VTGRTKTATGVGINLQTYDGIIAAILGGVSFGGGSGGMGGAFLGLLIINTFNNGLTIVGLSASWTLLASGLLLLIAIIFDTFISKKTRRQ
jgi:ribose/xylose/arabinose/galactoside ABC-type transport system permease subunit